MGKPKVKGFIFIMIKNSQKIILERLELVRVWLVYFKDRDN